MQAALTLPQVMTKLLSAEPETLKQVILWSKQPLWKRALEPEMEGLIDSGVWDQVPCPHYTLLVDTKPVFKRKID